MQGNIKNSSTLKSQLDNTKKRLKELKIRYGLGDIDRETYELTLEHLNNQLRIVHAESNRMTPGISNLENFIRDAFDKLGNLGQIWLSANLDGKRRLHKVLFPDGVYYDVKNHQYLTKSANGFLMITQSIVEQYAENEKRTFQSNAEKSNSAPPVGRLSNYFLKDLLAFSDLAD